MHSAPRTLHRATCTVHLAPCTVHLRPGRSSGTHGPRTNGREQGSTALGVAHYISTIDMMLEFISWMFVPGLQCTIEPVSLNRVCDCSDDLQCHGCEVLDCAALSLATSSRASGSANLLLVSQRPRAAAHVTGIPRSRGIVSPVERASLPAAAARQLDCLLST